MDVLPDRDDDVLRYQGLAFSWIDLTNLHSGLTICLELYEITFRSTSPDLPVYMRLQQTPRRGHHWVKKMFIDPSPYNISFNATDIEWRGT